MLKKIILLSLTILFTVISCKNENSKKFHLKGEIINMTKGTVLLGKLRDDQLVLVDSFQVRDNGKFEFSDYLSSPEMYYIILKEFPGDKASVFVEPKEINFTTHIERFISDVKVSGSENHKLYDEFNAMKSKFSDENLLLIQQQYLAEKAKDSSKIDSIATKYKQHLRRKYLFTTNFAVNHADQAISPYLALTELHNANTFLLDTIYKAMTDDVKKSYYGKIFRRYYTKSDKNLKN